jgi:hypothetical protein
MFPWRLAVNEDPPLDQQPSDTAIQEDLTEEEQQEKGEIISKMRKVDFIIFLYASVALRVI